MSDPRYWLVSSLDGRKALVSAKTEVMALAYAGYRHGVVDELTTLDASGIILEGINETPRALWRADKTIDAVSDDRWEQGVIDHLIGCEEERRKYLRRVEAA